MLGTLSHVKGDHEDEEEGEGDISGVVEGEEAVEGNLYVEGDPEAEDKCEEDVDEADMKKSATGPLATMRQMVKELEKHFFSPVY